MKINTLSTSRLHNEAHFQLQAEFRDLIAAHGAELLKIKPQFDEYRKLYEREDEALKKIVKSALTEKINEADAARDSIFIGMADVCKGMCRHFNPEIRDAALRVQVLFDTYGNVAYKPLNEETAAIHNITQDLQSDKYAADVAAICIAPWVPELKARNNAFEALVKERFSETAGKTDIAIKDARRELDAAYRKICDIINVYVMLEGEANYADFIKTLNAVIAKYAVKHHHRHHGDQPQPTGGSNDV
jgi:hypothetical protein